MRLLTRLVLLVTLVLGVSLAFAWAWDHSDDAALSAPLPARDHPSN